MTGLHTSLKNAIILLYVMIITLILMIIYAVDRPLTN